MSESTPPQPQGENTPTSGNTPTGSPVSGSPAPQAEERRFGRLPRKPPPNRLRRAGLAALIGIAVIAVIQLFAAETDYQYAFLGSTAVGFVTILAVLYQLQRAAARKGWPWVVPAAAVAVLAALVVLFRFDSFSGEMVPQFTWRFGGRQAPPLVTEVLQPSPADRADVEAPRAGPDGDAAEPKTAEATAAEESREDPEGSRGFLGNRRDGVWPERTFAVPTSPEQAEELWRIGIGEGWSSFAVAGNLAVTLEQRDKEECVTAYRLSDGELRWIRKQAGYHDHLLGGRGPRSTPTILGDRVYAQGATGRVWCLELATGELIWQANLLELAGWSQGESEEAILWGRAGSPLLVDGLCVVPFGAPAPGGGPGADGRSLIAFDADNGEIRWTAGEDQISYASPQLMVLDGVRQIVSVNESSVSGHEVDSGTTLWSFPWPGQSNASANCAAAIPAGENRFLLGKGYGGGSALVEVRIAEDDELAAEAVWTSTQLLKTKFNHAVVDGDVAYGLSNGTLEAVDLEQRERLWRQSRRDRYGQGQVIRAGDVLVVQAEAGEVAFVEATPETYRELGRLPALSSKTWNIPTLAGRLLLVRNDRQAICFRLPPRE